jgi:O-antigen/teichoic acid export membrane protein
MTTRFLLAVGGLYLTRTSWGGLTGIALSGLLVFFPTLAMLMALSTGDREPVDIQLPSPLRMIPLALSFTVYTAITYLDIVTSYLLLNKSALGVYSASSVLPKGILLFTTPIIQVAFPVMVRGGSAEIPGRALFMKGFLATVLIGGVALLLVWSTADYNCGSTYGIQTCDREIMGFALAGILPLMILRVLVIDQLSRRNDWHPLALLVPVALFAVYFLVSIRDIDHLAISFLVFGYATLAYYGAICFYSAIKQNSASTTFV